MRPRCTRLVDARGLGAHDRWRHPVVMGKPLGSGTLDSYQIYITGTTVNAFVSDAVSFGTILKRAFSPALGTGTTWHSPSTTRPNSKRCI